VWIEIDFDQRIFPDYVWSDFFRAARTLGNVVGHELERVRVTGHAVTIDGHATKIVRVAVTLRVSDDPQTLTIEVASRSRWRTFTDSASEDVPFQVFMPDAGHDYERDILRRNELQIGLLQNEVTRWARELRGADGGSDSRPPDPPNAFPR